MHSTSTSPGEAVTPPAPRLNAEQLVARHRTPPRVDAARMRREADDFFGPDDHADDDPFERARG